MAFRVILTDPALAEVEEAADYIWDESPVNARRWLTEFWQAVETLRNMPSRHALIPEAETIGIPYRSLPHHSHRIIYRIVEEQAVVYIVRVYHSARKPLGKEDL